MSQRRNALQDWLDLDVRSWFAGRILPVAESIAERWGHLAAIAKHQGLTLAVVDGIIAATALEHSLTLVNTECEGLCWSQRGCSQPLGRRLMLRNDLKSGGKA